MKRNTLIILIFLIAGIITILVIANQQNKFNAETINITTPTTNIGLANDADSP